MVRVPRWGVGRPGHSHPVSSGEGAEVIVEAVVLLDDDHYVIDLARHWSTRRLLHRNHVRIGDHPKESILRLFYCHEQTSSNQAGHVTLSSHTRPVLQSHWILGVSN